MQKTNKEIKPSDRSLDKRAVAAGVVGLLGLAVVCLFLGFYCLGPIVQSHMRAPDDISQAPQYTPPAPPEAESPAKPEEQPALDVEITEQVADTASSSDNGVKQDGNNLTVTLDQGNTSDTAEKPRVSTEHESRSSEASEKSSYRVQAGAFASKSNADVLVVSLKDQGYKPEIKTVQSGESTLYRVQLGTYKTREDAQKLADDLTAHGFSPSVVAE